jgi:hypothetical protein
LGPRETDNINQIITISKWTLNVKM